LNVNDKNISISNFDWKFIYYKFNYILFIYLIVVL
jgi:hypothetical protein